MGTCGECGVELGVADPAMLKAWIARTAANFGQSKHETSGKAVFVCPACDSYALGVESTTGLPFYSKSIAAFVTVNDWDWWNRAPRDCDIRQWPDFGCLTFSEESLRSTATYLRESPPTALDPGLELPFARDLLGPTGIPEDPDPEGEWKHQLNILHARMAGEFSTRELDACLRILIRILSRAEGHRLAHQSASGTP